MSARPHSQDARIVFETEHTSFHQGGGSRGSCRLMGRGLISGLRGSEVAFPHSMEKKMKIAEIILIAEQPVCFASSVVSRLEA